MRIALAFVIALSACVNEKPTLTPDAGNPPSPDAMPDTPPEATLTSYVIDLITMQTTSTAAPRAYAEFASLPDPDGDTNNTAAYQSLFP